ncbi:MAG TPA: hypothetical protein VF136_16770 [Methylomirabilota bacterium]
MTNRALRAALVIAALGALGVGSYTVFRAELARRAAASARTGFDDRARTLAADIARLQASQQAYVAHGQGAEHWMTRAGEQLASIQRNLELLASTASSHAARAAVQSARGSIDELRQIDARARQYVSSEQLLMASDVIFTDGLAAGAAGLEHLAQARTHEVQTLDRQAAALHERQLYATAGAAAVLVLALLLLAPVPQADVDVLTAMRALTSTPAQAGAAARLATPEPVARDEFSEVVVPARPAPRLPDTAPADAAPPAPTAEAPPAPPAVDLTAAAGVCADLARVLDAGDLPDLLARAAAVLQAPGLIVWVSDREGRELYPLLTHGYPANVVLRLGTIPTSADNATAAAWRVGALQVVPGADQQPGALVAPVVTGDGCVGTFSAEVSAGREQQPEVQALATIFAAQLATFVTAVPADQRAQMAQG